MAKSSRADYAVTSSRSLPGSLPTKQLYSEIPGLPGFYSSGPAVLTSHSYRGQQVLHSYSPFYCRCYNINEIVDHFEKESSVPQSPGSSQRQSLITNVWMPAENRPDCVKVAMIPDGRLLAYSEFFVAMFSPRYAVWLVEYAAAAALFYHPTGELSDSSSNGMVSISVLLV